MRILVLDISSSLGWARLEGTCLEDVKIDEYGVLKLDGPILSYHSDYPWCYILAAEAMADKVMKLIYTQDEWPDAIVIEETNLGKSRYNQKFLEQTHGAILRRLRTVKSLGLKTSSSAPEEMWRVVYLDSSEWRKNLGLVLTKEQKKANAKLAKAKREAAAHGMKVDKKTLGIKGKTTKKHVAIDYANQKFDLKLKAKDDDIADALCIGCAFFNNAVPCDGT